MLEYCPLVWSGDADGHLRRLDKVQKRALSLIEPGTIVGSLAHRRTVGGFCFLYKLLTWPLLPTLRVLLTHSWHTKKKKPRTTLHIATARPSSPDDLPVRSDNSILGAFPYRTITAWDALPFSVLETACTNI